MAEDKAKAKNDEKNMTPEQLLRLRKSQMQACIREGEEALERTDAGHRQATAKFRVERSNIVRDLNIKRQGDIEKLRQRADNMIANAKAEMEKTLDAAKKKYEDEFKAARDKVADEFNTKADEQAVAFNRDHEALVAEQGTEHNKVLREWEKAKETLAAQIATLEASIPKAEPTLDKPKAEEAPAPA